MLGNSGPSTVGLQSEHRMGRDQSMDAQDSSGKENKEECDGGMWGNSTPNPTPVSNVPGSAEKREVNKAPLNVETAIHKLDIKDGTIDVGMYLGHLDNDPDKFTSDTPITQSEKSFNVEDGEFWSETSASSPDELSVNYGWSQGAKLVHSRDTKAMVLWKAKWVPRVKDSTQDMSSLNPSKGHHNSSMDLGSEASKETTENSLSGDAKLKLHRQINRVKEVKAFFERFTGAVQSGQRNELVPLVLHTDYPLIKSKDGIGATVLSALSLTELVNIVEEVSRSSDELAIVVAHISQSNIGTLEDFRPGYRNIKLTSMSFTPVGALKDSTYTKMMCHWVLSRQMGLLRPVTMEKLHILQPIDLNGRLTTGCSYCHRLRGPFNIRGRWYSIQAYRATMREYSVGLKTGRFPEPAYDPLPRDYDKCLLEQKFLEASLDLNIAKRISATGWENRSRKFGTMLMNEYRNLCTSDMEVNYLIDLYNNAEHNGIMNKALSIRALKLLHEQHKIDLPGDWQKYLDISGRLCWVNHEFYSLTYRRPTIARTAEAVESTRNRRLALIVSRIPRKAKLQGRLDQTSSSNKEYGDIAKAMENIANQPQRTFGLGPGDDTIDRSQLLVTTLPSVTNIIDYAPEEDSATKPDDSDDSPTSAKDITITPLPCLIAEILKELRECLLDTAPRDRVTGPENGELREVESALHSCED